MKRSIALVILGALVVTGPTPCPAGQVLYLDAADAGANPYGTWEDLSASGYDFENLGAAYNWTNKSYMFNGASQFLQGTGDESIFDFDVSQGGSADPFTVVLYVNPTAVPTEEIFSAAVSKTNSGGTGWVVAPRFAEANIDIILASGGPNRVYDRTGNMAAGWNLIMATIDGSGTSAGVTVYANGNTTPLGELYTEDALTASILTDEPLRIGRDVAFANNGYFKGEIGFVEIWDEVLDPSYIATRWNGGDPVRSVGPEPPPPPAPTRVLDFNAASGVTATGGLVDSWAADVGGVSATPSGGNSQYAPLLETGVFAGGQPGIHFDGYSRVNETPLRFEVSEDAAENQFEIELEGEVPAGPLPRAAGRIPVG